MSSIAARNRSLPSRRLAAWSLVLVLAFAAVYLAASPLPLALVAVPVMAVGALALLRWPWLGLALLVFSVPVQQVGAFGAGPVSLTATRASLGLALIGYAVALTVFRRHVQLTRLAAPFAALIAWMVVTSLTAQDIDAALAEAGRWSIAFVALIVAIQFLKRAEPRVIVALVFVMAVAGAMESVIGTARGLLALGPESFQVGDAFSRAYGTFGRPNTFAAYLELTLFPALWVGLYSLPSILDRFREYRRERICGVWTSRSTRNRLAASAIVASLLIGASATMLLGVATSFSRGAWLGVAAGLGVTGLVAARRFWHLLAPGLPLAVLLIIAVGSQLAPDAVSTRLGSIVDEARPFDASSIPITDENFAVAERMAHWQAGWRMFEDHPLTGVGIGNYNARYPDYFVRAEFRYSQGHAHNYYIHVLAETGMIGFALYLTVVLSFLFLSGWIALSASDHFTRALALGALGTTTALMVHNVFENLHVLNLGIQLSAAWALAIAAHARWTHSAAGQTGMEYSRV